MLRREEAGFHFLFVLFTWIPSSSLQHLLLTPTNAAGHFAFELDEILAPLLGSVHVCRALVVRVGEHRYDRDHDGLHCVDGQPPFASLFVAPFVISWLVEDGYAHITVLFNCRENYQLLCCFMCLTTKLTVGMPDFSDKLHLWWP